ncbi:MAG: hypothetical protein V1734_01970 [Nanoarchaeota archaeon]
MRLIQAIIIISIFTAFSAYAQYETLAGITADSPEYNDYKMCIDSCSQCEQNCKANTYRRAAETQNKEEFCNYLPEAEKQMCKERIYMSKAITSKDSAECMKITDEFQKSGCLLNVQTEKAIASENEAECNSLEANYAENCRQAFNMRMASLKNDESFCGKISDENVKAICKSSIAVITERPAPEIAEEQLPAEPSGIKSKSLIIYGIIILCVIIPAVIAIAIIKKARKKPAQAHPLVVQQQKFPPLVMQPQQGTPQTAQQGEKR